MAVILEERGRGKFRPVLDCDLNEVREVLNKRIEEERNTFGECSEEIDFKKLLYVRKISHIYFNTLIIISQF